MEDDNDDDDDDDNSKDSCLVPMFLVHPSLRVPLPVVLIRTVHHMDGSQFLYGGNTSDLNEI